MSSEIAALEADKRAYLEQLEVVQAQLKDDPDNAELKGLQVELKEMVTLLDESLSELKPKQSAAPPKPPKGASSSAPAASDSRSRRDETGNSPPPAADERDDVDALRTYRVNDNVLARWVSGDKAFYSARITAVTGSSTAPMYTVKFKSYDTIETLRAKDIRPPTNKRKADGAPASSSTTFGSAPPNSGATTAAPPPPATPSAPAQPQTAGAASSGLVMSAAASLYPNHGAQDPGNKPGQDGTVKPPKAKKIKANKELEAGKSKWQDFNKSKFGKSHKKDSMFRTPEGIHGRVGFTGSGQAMRKDASRSRHVYQMNEEMD